VPLPSALPLREDSFGPVCITNISGGVEPFAIPYRSHKDLDVNLGFTYVSNSVRRDLLNERIRFLHSSTSESFPCGLFTTKEEFYRFLKIGYKEHKRTFERRKRIGLELEELKGCGKCRWKEAGCGKCNAPGFVLGDKEGISGGIPRPASEFGLQRCLPPVPHTGGSATIKCFVTNDTPTCRNIVKVYPEENPRGVIASEDIATGTHIME